MAVSRGDNRDPEPPAANSPKSSPNPHQTQQSSSSPKPSEDHANPEATTPEQRQEQEQEEEAREESEERIRGLLKAYQQTLDTVHDLPTVVWVPWARKGVGRYFMVPYHTMVSQVFRRVPHP
jgi:hypothetical protein